MISGDGRSWNYLRSWPPALIYFLQLFRRINASSSGSARGAAAPPPPPPAVGCRAGRRATARSFLSHRRLKFRWGEGYGSAPRELLINWRILLLPSDGSYGNTTDTQLAKPVALPISLKLKPGVVNYIGPSIHVRFRTVNSFWLTRYFWVWEIFVAH